MAGNGTFRSRLKKILGVMIPILITQLCITGMSLFDTVMSGHAGTVQLAGVAIGTNVWMPVFTGLNGILQALTPIVANYRAPGNSTKSPAPWSAAWPWPAPWR